MPDVRRTLSQSFPAFAALLAAGAIVRVAVALLTTNSQDIALFGYIVAQGAQGHGLYDDPGFSYPPLVGYLWLAAGKLLAIFGAPIVVHATSLAPFAVPGLMSADLTTPIASLFIKLPAMLGDCALALVVDQACRRVGATDAARRFAVLAVWLNPIVIFDSAVQASWDCTVPLSIIAAGIAAVDGDAAASGAWLAAGALMKVVPISLAPLIVAALWRARSSIGRLASAAASGAIVIAIALLPVAAWAEIPALKDALVGGSGMGAFGGFNAWTSLNAYALAPAERWLTVHGSSISMMTEVISLAGIIVVALMYLRSSTATFERFTLAAIATLSIILFAAPYVQPGYVVWVVPLCAIVGALGRAHWNAILFLASGCALAFALTVRALAALAVPACWFFHLCDPVALASAAHWYAYESGTTTPLAQLDIGLIWGIAGTLIFLLIAWTALREWRRLEHA